MIDSVQVFLFPCWSFTWLYIHYGSRCSNCPISILNCLFLPLILSVFASCIWALSLGLYIFIIVRFSWWIDIFVFYYKMFFLSPVIFYVLKSILPAMSIGTPSFLWLIFVWHSPFCVFIFSLFVSSNLKHVSNKCSSWTMSFFFYPVLKSLPFNDIVHILNIYHYFWYNRI